MRIRILFIIPTLDHCGAEKQLTLLACNLPKDKFEIKVAVLTRSGPYREILEANGIPVELIGKKSKFSLKAYFRLKKLIQDYNPTIVHTWLFAANAYGRKAALVCKTPIIICGERCLDPWKSSWQFWIDHKLEPGTDVFAVNSTGIVDFYTKHGLPSEKFVVIPNAVVPPSHYIPDKQELKKEILQELGLSWFPERRITSFKDTVFHEMNISGANENPSEELPFFIGVLARLWPQKRVKDALWAADQLKFAQLNFYLLVFGDGPERESLLRYREDLELRDRVVFLGERSDVERFIPSLDLVWNCSAYEGQSNSILEAQSYGIPVIASDIPGNKDLIITGKNGLLISEFDGDDTRRRTAFSRESIRLLKPVNKALREQFGKEAQKKVENDFSVSKMIERYTELYENLYIQKCSNTKCKFRNS